MDLSEYSEVLFECDKNLSGAPAKAGALMCKGDRDSRIIRLHIKGRFTYRPEPDDNHL